MTKAQLELLIFNRVKAISSRFIGEPANDKTQKLIEHAVLRDPILKQLSINSQPIVRPVIDYIDKSIILE